MKKLVLIILFSGLFLVVFNSRLSAQTASVDHIALYVFDLNKSAAFYKNVMQFKEVPEPFHDGKHIWLQIGPNAKLHLIKGAAAVTEKDINSHFAYHVPVLQKFINHLEETKVKYGNWKGDTKEPQLRPDGVKQIYLQDPDNNWIEVNDDKS